MLLSCQGGRSEEKDRLRGRAGHVTAEAALELKLKRGDRKRKREEVEKESCAGAPPAKHRTFDISYTTLVDFIAFFS
jgi:hypothetical protein